MATAAVRLYAILARSAPRAVVFRRGPSKQTLLVAWKTDDDTFEEGQWLKGRIYEMRCDLSPSGSRLIYFAGNQKPPFGTWTAISRPPFLTALALWPKGDAWGGGGLFEDENHVLLNHREGERELAEGFTLPRQMRVDPLWKHAGWGEDNPIIDYRLMRDGWLFEGGGEAKQSKERGLWLEIDPPAIWMKHSVARGVAYELRSRTRGIKKENGPWYVLDYEVSGMPDLGRANWADWSPSGDLLFARGGRLYRLPRDRHGRLDDPASARLLIDLTDRKFTPKAPPAEALRWK